MLEELQDKENRRLIRRLVAEVLTEREADIIRRRYGLDGRLPQTQKQVAALDVSHSFCILPNRHILLRCIIPVPPPKWQYPP